MSHAPHLSDAFTDFMSWYFELGLELLDRHGAHATAARISSALDILDLERRQQEYSPEQVALHEEELALVLAMFERHKTLRRNT
jgi:hypothetical protein